VEKTLLFLCMLRYVNSVRQESSFCSCTRNALLMLKILSSSTSIYMYTCFLREAWNVGEETMRSGEGATLPPKKVCFSSSFLRQVLW